jgi:hypothetical protein
MKKTILKNRLVTGVQFANGDRKAAVGMLAINHVKRTDGPEAVGFYFYEALDRLISDDDKRRIAGALADLFNYAVQCGEVDDPHYVVGRTDVKVGYEGMRSPG